VAAADVAARPSEPEVHPRRARLQTLLAAERARRDASDSIRVAAFVCHQTLPSAATGSPDAARNAWIVAITCAPSPTAAATRLTEPARTSPIANTPSRLGSSDRPPEATSAPVRTKPFASRATSDSESHDVFGSAPMKRNR